MHENVSLQSVNVYINAVPKKSDQGLQASKCYNIQQQHEQNGKSGIRESESKARFI